MFREVIHCRSASREEHKCSYCVSHSRFFKKGTGNDDCTAKITSWSLLWLVCWRYMVEVNLEEYICTTKIKTRPSPDTDMTTISAFEAIVLHSLNKIRVERALQLQRSRNIACQYGSLNQARFSIFPWLRKNCTHCLETLLVSKSKKENPNKRKKGDTLIKLPQ